MYATQSNHHAWLEYSVAKDAVFCFYCYPFKQPRAENYCVDFFTIAGFHGWERWTLIGGHGVMALLIIMLARRDYQDYKNQR